MPFWVLAYLDNYRPSHSLQVLARTLQPAHMFMKWSTIKPTRHKIYKRVRGANVWCGYKYIWDTPNLVEQIQPGDTFEHLFGPIALTPSDHVWYYLFSWLLAPTREHQGPLIHVWPPEIPMASARIFNSLDQPIPSGVPTALSYDSILWDDALFYDPALPTRLTIPANGLYHVGCCQHLSFPHDPGHRISIRLNGADVILMHGHRSLWPDPPGSTTSLHTVMRFVTDDYLQVIVYHWTGAPRNCAALPHYSPHFWITLAGDYPV